MWLLASDNFCRKFFGLITGFLYAFKLLLKKKANYFFIGIKLWGSSKACIQYNFWCCLRSCPCCCIFTFILVDIRNIQRQKICFSKITCSFQATVHYRLLISQSPIQIHVVQILLRYMEISCSIWAFLSNRLLNTGDNEQSPFICSIIQNHISC